MTDFTKQLKEVTSELSQTNQRISDIAIESGKTTVSVSNLEKGFENLIKYMGEDREARDRMMNIIQESGLKMARLDTLMDELPHIRERGEVNSQGLNEVTKIVERLKSQNDTMEIRLRSDITELFRVESDRINRVLDEKEKAIDVKLEAKLAQVNSTVEGNSKLKGVLIGVGVLILGACSIGGFILALANSGNPKS